MFYNYNKNAIHASRYEWAMKKFSYFSIKTYVMVLKKHLNETFVKFDGCNTFTLFVLAYLDQGLLLYVIILLNKDILTVRL